MENQEYPKRYAKKTKFHWKVYLFIAFAGILLFIIYSSFYPNNFSQSITGNVIAAPELKNSVDFTASLTTPEKLETKSKIDKIELKTKEPSTLYIGNQKIELDSPTSIIIDNYEGSLKTESNSMTLDGKTTKIYLNGMPLSPTISKATISLNQAKFEYLKLNNVYLTSLTYTTSGQVRVNNKKITVNLEDEKIHIDEFAGNLKIKRNQLTLAGFIEKSNLQSILELSSNPEAAKKL